MKLLDRIRNKLRRTNIHIQSRRGMYLYIDSEEISLLLGDVHWRFHHPIIQIHIINWIGGRPPWHGGKKSETT
jgi:hypothetical protein